MDTQTGKALRVAQIVIGAMIVGLGAFAAIIMLLQAPPSDLQPQTVTVLLLGLAGLGGTQLVAYFFLRRALWRSARQAFEEANDRPIPVAALFQRLFLLTLVSAALAETFGMFGLVVYSGTRVWLALIAPALALLALVALLPTPDRFARFVEDVTGQPWP
ncbi:MAG: hypothetical protein KKB50_05530 [Planctomycetes bacterium]|nr:hypothetical protein [Planctomycetota bacterium]